MTARRIGVAAFVGIAVVMVAVSSAWACTGQPQIFTVSPLTAPAGSEVTMRGAAVSATAPVELRWNGVAGPKLAEVTADARASFEMAFTVPPDVPPGVYSLLVVTGEGAVKAVGRTTMEVSGAGARAIAPALADGGFAAETEAAGLRAASAGSSPALLAGIGLLGFASVTLVGSLAFTLRRRPALAGSSSER